MKRKLALGLVMLLIGLQLIGCSNENKENTKEEMESRMLDNLASDEKIIFERFPFFEEWVYGRILRGVSKFNFDDDIYKKIKSYKPSIIYCRPSTEKILEWRGREQMIGVIEESEALIKEFDKIHPQLQ